MSIRDFFKSISSQKWIVYAGRHEIVAVFGYVNGLETVYLNGEVVSEKRNLRSLKSVHQIDVEGQIYEIKVIVRFNNVSVELYQDNRLVDYAEKIESSNQKKVWFWFLFGCLLGAFFLGFSWGASFP